MTNRAVIYARYSTDLQNDQSVEDQIRLCEGHAERLGLLVVGKYFDRAKSGASLFGRPGLTNLMAASEAGDFDFLISEAPDRISRDIADLAHIHKNLRFRGVEMNCVNGGAMDTLQIGMHGVMGQMQREEGAKKVKRGMVGVIRSGRNAGGKAYGYRPVLGKPGELEIVEAEAAVVRRIFDMYAGGVAPRSIASALNAEGVPAPRGIHWNSSTINGNGQRGNGILRNPLYAGRLIWNRVRMVKDPSTGKRISRINPESEHEEIAAPHLRILSDELFEAVQRRKEATGGKHSHTTPKNKRLLSGLLKCGQCGGGLSIVGSDRSGPRVVCSNHKESGSCSNRGRYYVEKIERRVVDTLRMQFADTAIIDAYVQEYQAERRRVEIERRRGRAALEKAHADAIEAITRIVEKLSKGLIEDDDAAAILPGLRLERDRCKRELSAEPPLNNVLEIKPKAVALFRQDIESLAETLSKKDAEPSLELAMAFRRVIASVVVAPRLAGEGYKIEINGFLASLVSPELSAVLMVAGEGLEPPTRGL
ncbi:recombinase family protein [Rhizobium tubonense]|uniref:Recombinase family protein n=1 Tax=Rhizobium tubonense TaxID=484088 RepID=A0A2W4E794_9HYPH|nr:recombinase family protein [Rhizobium tubonense]PZM07670.1 recombinase family protein [Rhizobium tubonense]